MKSRKFIHMPAPDTFQSLVTQYFSDFYPASPIFIYEWVSGGSLGPGGISKISEAEQWICFNVILAIAYCVGAVDVLATPGSLQTAEAHLQNALAGIHELLAEPPTIATVQALLGMGAATHELVGPGPASVLIAAALRDSYRLGLHRKVVPSTLDGIAVFEQRERVFWTAYSLHRDLSLRLNLPMVFDDEIELDLPSIIAADDALLFYSFDRKYAFNMYHARTHLAVIEGHLRRRLLASDDVNRSIGITSAHIACTHLELMQWRNNLLIPFEADFLMQNFDLAVALQIIILHSSYYHCLRAFQAALKRQVLIQEANQISSQSLWFYDSAMAQLEIACAREMIDCTPVLKKMNSFSIRELLNSLVIALGSLIDNSLQYGSGELLEEDVSRCQPLLELLEKLPTTDRTKELHQVLQVHKNIGLKPSRSLPRKPTLDSGEL